MVDINIRIEEDKLKELLYDIFDSLSIGDAMDYPMLYKKYIDSLVDSGSATFFYGPVNLNEWIKDIIVNTEVITPSHCNYNEIYNSAKNEKYELSNGQVIVAEYNECILLEYYS